MLKIIIGLLALINIVLAYDTPGPIPMPIPNPTPTSYKGVSNGCFWDECQDETKAFSTYFDGLSYDNKKKVSEFYSTCAQLFGDDTREQCEKQYSYSSYTETQLIDFYQCIQKCYQKSNDLCRTENESCQFCKDNENCTTFMKDTVKVASQNDSASQEKCSLNNETSCPSSLLQVAQDSCSKYGAQTCKNDWVKANVSEEDPCYFCEESSASQLIFSALLASLLAFIL